MKHQGAGFGRRQSQPGRGGGVDAGEKGQASTLSSGESDFTSSNPVSMQFGNQGEGFSNYNGERNPASAGGCSEENGREVHALYRENLDADPLEEKNSERSENHLQQMDLDSFLDRQHMDLDSFLESIVLLQAAQEALEKGIAFLHVIATYMFPSIYSIRSGCT